MKIKKIIFYVLGILLALIIITGVVATNYLNGFLFRETPSYLVFSTDAKPIDFQWVSEKFGDYVEPHSAIIIPTKIEGFPQQLYTGAPSTMIYENPLKSLEANGFEFNIIEKDDKKYVEHFTCELGGSQIEAGMIKILEGFGRPVDISDTLSGVSIGTIGADFMDKKITLIDFKNEYIQLYDIRPDWMVEIATFKPFDFKARRFILPAIIDDKELDLFYDSGSSAFGLITSKNRYDKYSDKNKDEIKYDMNSWGNAIAIRHKASEELLTIGGANLELKRVSYVNMYTPVQGLIAPFARIGGLLGNKPFTESRVIFDTNTEEFVVLEGTE